MGMTKEMKKGIMQNANNVTFEVHNYSDKQFETVNEGVLFGITEGNKINCYIGTNNEDAIRALINASFKLAKDLGLIEVNRKEIKVKSNYTKEEIERYTS